MNSHDVTLAGYLICVLLCLVVQWASSRPDARVPSIGALLTWIMRTRSGRVGVTAGWMWLGMHYFAR